MSDVGTLAYEFPDFDAATLPAIPDRFDASHWHNEAMPHWVRHVADGAPAYLELWIDYADTALRDFPEGQRFLLRWRRSPQEDPSLVLEHTDDWALILAAIEQVEARVIAARWVARFGLGFHPDTRGRDYVLPDFARCLTDAEADEYDTEINRLFELGGDPYQHGLDAMRAAGLLRPGEGERAREGG